MKRSEMNSGQKAVHNEELCKKVINIRRANNSEVSKLMEQVKELNFEISKIHTKTTNLSMELCEKEGVSFRFINRILSGNSKKEDEIEKLEAQENGE